jgi:glycosyltransferase involved in cell wall biosynthesis
VTSSRGWPGQLELLIPHYGSEQLLREAVESVLHQTNPNWTLTVVEDGARTGSPIEGWLGSLDDARVRYESNHATLGVAGNFQRCLDLASGEFVTFLGCDDRLLPEYVDLVSNALSEHSNVSVVQPGVQIIDPRGELCSPLADRLKALVAPKVREPRVLDGERLLVSLMRGNWTYFPSMVWRRALLDRIGFRQDLDVALDLVALASLVLDDGSMLLLPDVAFEYRRHVGSASSLAAANADRFVEERRVLDELAARARARGWHRASRAARVRVTSRAHAAALLPEAMRTRSWDPARKFVRHALGS